MSGPAFRTLDGAELALPVRDDRWVLVPRELARAEPDLIWTLEYEDAPLTPQLRDELGGDPWLDCSDGALLVPIERWNTRAAIEPALVGGGTGTSAPAAQPRFTDVPLWEHRAPMSDVARAARSTASMLVRSADISCRAARWTVGAVALALAMSFAVAVGGWLVALHDGLSGSELGNGVILLCGATLLAALSRRLCRGTLGAAAHAIFSAGAALVAFVFAVFLVGLGP